jgi:hypothetical protein
VLAHAGKQGRRVVSAFNMTLETMAPLSDDPFVKLPAVAA